MNLCQVVCMCVYTAWFQSAMEMCMPHFYFPHTVSQEFLMHLFLPKFILCRLTVGFSDFNLCKAVILRAIKAPKAIRNSMSIVCEQSP